jgi:hypothetical protein
MRYGLLLVVLLVPACGSKKVVSETWQAAYLEGARIGHTQTLVTQVGDTYHTVRTVKLTVKRYGKVLSVETDQTCDETADGKVLALELDSSLGADKLGATARVEGKKVHIKSGKAERSEAWDENNLGIYAQEQTFARRKVKPGDRFSLTSFELSAQLPLTLRVEVKNREKVDRLVLDGDKVKRDPVELLRAEIVSDPVFIGGVEKVVLPAKTVWLDGDGQVVREQFEFPGLGLITQYTTTKETVLKESVDPDLLPDLGTKIMIPLNKSIDRPYDTMRVHYRVTVDGTAKAPFVEDDRQEVKLPLGRTFELWVKSVREPGREARPSPGKEFTESNHFIDSDDALIKALANKVAGDEKRPYELALKMEKWVHEHMQFDAGVGFPAASKTAVGLKGDCRQHALLLAALLRAKDVPSRTALGLIYTSEPGKGPVFAFHMWTEAYLGGRWIGLDAIQGKGFVGATHLAMVQHSWAGTQTLAPLLPIAGVLGKLKIEVLDAR